MSMSPSTHGDLAGDVIASVIGNALSTGVPLWRAVCGVLDMYYADKWLQISFDPSVDPYYLNDITPYPQKTVALQIDPDDTDIPVAIWIKTGADALEWTRVWPGNAADDHLVLTDLPLDSAPGTLDGKIITTDGITKQVVVDGGIRKLLIGHQPATPAQVATTLYPAKVDDPNNRGQCVCVFGPYYSCGSSLWDNWTEISPGVMRRDITGPVSSVQFDGVTVLDDSVPPPGTPRTVYSQLIGKRIFAFYAASTDADKARSGPWIVDDTGEHWGPTVGHPEAWSLYTTQARMHRDPNYTAGSELVKGMTFQIQTGNGHGGDYFTLDTDQPITLDSTPLAWTITDIEPYPWNDKHELCTGPDLTTEGVSLEPQISIGTYGGSAGTYWSSIFDGYTGTQHWSGGMFREFIASSALGLASLPAGPIKVNLQSVTISGLNAIGSFAYVGVEFWEITPDGSTLVGNCIARGRSIPLTNGATAGVVFSANIPSPRACSPTNHLFVFFCLLLDCTDNQTQFYAQFSYGAPWGTFITVPWQMSVTGAATGDHQQLSRRDQDVASSDPTKADPCHPYESLGPSGRHFHRVAAGTMVGNILTFPSDASTCVVTLTGPTTLDGIVATGFLPDDSSVECPVSIRFEGVSPTYQLTVHSGHSVTSPAEPVQLVTASGVAKDWGSTRRCRLELVHNSTTHTWDETSRNIY